MKKLQARNYQKTGAVFLAGRSGILGDGVGLGKTYTALLAVQRVRAEMILIICPKHLKTWWIEEIKNAEYSRTPDVDIIECLYKGVLPQVTVITDDGERAYILAHYEQFRGVRRRPKPVTALILSGDWDVAICDEVHRIKNPVAQTTKWVNQLRATYRWGLTGTPAPDKPKDVWGLLHWVAPTQFKHYGVFLRRYCYTNTNGFSGQLDAVGVIQDRLPELRQVTAPYLLVRRIEDIGLELPPRQLVDVPLQMSGEQVKHYKKVKQQAIVELEQGAADGVLDLSTRQLIITSAGARFTRLHQVSSDPTDPKIGRADIPNVKLDWLHDYVQGGGDPAVILTRYRHTARTIREHLSKWGAEGYIVGTWAGLAEGLNLQDWHVMILWDLDYSRMKWEQGLGRCHRSGQKHKVLIYRLTASPVDRRVRKKIDQKETDIQMLTDWLRGLFDEE